MKGVWVLSSTPLPSYSMANTIKKNWLKVDETCPTCNQVTKQVRGLTKQNLRKLLVPKWDMTEVIITLLLITLIVLSFAYKNETQICRDYVSGLDDNIICLDDDCNTADGGSGIPNFNLTNINVPG